MNPNDLSDFNELFLKTSKKHLNDVEYNLNLLRSSIETEEISNELYLHLHSLKGECNVMGYNDIGQLCEEALKILKSELDKPNTSQNLLSSLQLPIKNIKLNLDAIANGKTVTR